MSKETVMALGAHHDDVELRCGGTIAKYANEGCRVIYSVATSSPYYSSRNEHIRRRLPSNRDIVEIRKEEASEGASILGASEVHFFDFRSLYWYREGTCEHVYFDGCRHTLKDLENIERSLPGREYIVSAAFSAEAVAFLAEFLSARDVSILLTHSADDAHWEHYSVALFARTVVRTLSSRGKNVKLFHWECGSAGTVNRGFAPSRYVDITATVDLKCRALEVFKSQVAAADTSVFSRYARARARAYGRIYGCEYAEPFMEVNTAKAGFANADVVLPATYNHEKAFEGLG